MKVLFVCQRNNGRSQIAKGIYNKLTNSSDADAAGLTVDKHGQFLNDRAQEPGSDVAKVIEVMNEIHIDVAESPRIQFEMDQLEAYDKIIVILEPSEIQEELKAAHDVEVWNINDPKTKDLEGVRRTRNEIKEKVVDLIGIV